MRYNKLLLLLIGLLLVVGMTSAYTTSDVFKSLDSNNKAGNSEFTLFNPSETDLDISNLDISFVELAGKVVDYRLLILNDCVINVPTIRKGVPVYNTVIELINGTNISKEYITNNSDIIDTINVSDKCYEPATVIPSGENKYKIEANIKMEELNGGFGYKVDWIPTLTIPKDKESLNLFEKGLDVIGLLSDTESLEMKEWAWWNTSYQYKRPINCSNSTTEVPIMINGTKGFKIGNDTQWIWTTCNNTNNLAVYYTNSTFYTVAGDYGKVPFEVEKGNVSSSSDYRNIWSNYFMVYHFGSSATLIDSLGSWNGTKIGIATIGTQSSNFYNGSLFTPMLTGNNGYNTTSGNPVNSTNIFIESISNVRSTNASLKMIISKSIYDGQYNAWDLYINSNGTLGFDIGYNTTAFCFLHETPVTEQSYTFFTARFNSSTQYIYSNGSKSTQASCAYSMANTTYAQKGIIVGEYSNPLYPYSGTMDELRVSGKAFNDSYVSSTYKNYNNTLGYGNALNEINGTITLLLNSPTINTQQNALFQANYSNSSTYINGSGVLCNLTYNNASGWSTNKTMIFNSTSKLYEYSQGGFSVNNTYAFNVSCFNNIGLSNATSYGTFLVTALLPTINSFTLVPSNPYGLENQTFIINWSSPNNGSMTNYTKWYKNGVEQTNISNANRINISQMNSGENWTISVATNDTFYLTSYTNYSFYLPNITVYIQGLNPVLGTNMTGLNITLNNSGIFWRVNNTVVENNFFNLSKKSYGVNIQDNSGVFVFSANTSFDITTNPQYVTGTFAKTVYFNVMDETTGLPFNISHYLNHSYIFTATSTCQDGSYFENNVSSNTFVIPSSCAFSKFSFDARVDTINGTVFHYRSLLARSVSDIYNITFYVIPMMNSTMAISSFFLDDSIGQFQNKSLYLKKVINNVSTVIASEDLPASSRTNFYTILGNNYQVEVHSSNQPVFYAGSFTSFFTYNDEIIRLYQISISKPQNIGGVIKYATWKEMVNSSDMLYTMYNDSSLTTYNVTWVLTYGNDGPEIYNSTILLQNFVAVFNASNYTSSPIISKLIIRTPVSTTPIIYTTLYESTTIDFPLTDILSQETFNWILMFFIAIFSLYSTIRTANVVSLFIVGFAGLMLIFHLTTISMVGLGIAGIVALISVMSASKGADIQ